MRRTSARWVLPWALAASLPWNAFAGTGALAQLESLAADPSSAPEVFHGDTRQGSGQAFVAPTGSSSGRRSATLGSPSERISGLRTADVPSPKESKEYKEAADKGAKKGMLIGGIIGAITGGITAWAMVAAGVGIVWAVLAGAAALGGGIMIGKDVGAACGPDPDCR